MRKNGVNRELTEIDGGVCAPSGFYATAIRCGFSKVASDNEDLGLIWTKRRFPAAFVSTDTANVGACVALSQKHVRSGMASAVIINGGVANGYGEEADQLAENVSRIFANRLKTDRNDFILITAGDLGEKLDIGQFENGADTLAKVVKGMPSDSLAVARVITGRVDARHLACSFQIGDIACKIGAVFSGYLPTDNAVETLRCVLTTDVNISSEMLQKALKTAANEHFYALGGAVYSPNDCVCIMASGAAENWKITENNGDYQKFVHALCSFADKICRKIARDGQGKSFVCKVIGAKSKNVARETAKMMTTALPIRSAVAKRKVSIQALLNVILGGAEKIPYDKLSITLRSTLGTFVAYEEKQVQPVLREVEEYIFSGNEIELVIDLKDGNYSAVAYGCSTKI